MTLDLALLVLMALPVQGTSEGGAPSSDEEEERGPWTASAALGFALSAGNAESLTASGNLLLDYRTERWEWTLEADSLVARGDPDDDDDDDTKEVTHRYLARTRLEKRLTPLLGVYGLVGATIDHPAGIELRLDGEAGVAFTVLDRTGNEVQDWLLRFDLGAHYADERRREYDEDEDERDLGDSELVTPGLGLTFKCPLAERAKFHHVTRVLPDLRGDSRLRLDSSSTLAVFLTEHLALNGHALVDFDSGRAAGKDDADLTVTFGAEYEF